MFNSSTEATVTALEPSDFELAQASGKGDMEAFEKLYLRHHRRVYSICVGMTHSESLAEDLTQEVFVELFKPRTIKTRKVSSFKGDSKFTTWLHRFTVNQVLMHFRKKIYAKEVVGSEDNIVQILTDLTKSSQPEPVTERIDLMRALATLPKGYRNVFILHDIEGYEHQEVAHILGCDVGTSKSQLHKARKALRTKLGRKIFKLEKVFDWEPIYARLEAIRA